MPPHPHPLKSCCFIGFVWQHSITLAAVTWWILRQIHSPRAGLQLGRALFSCTNPRCDMPRWSLGGDGWMNLNIITFGVVLWCGEGRKHCQQEDAAVQFRSESVHWCHFLYQTWHTLLHVATRLRQTFRYQSLSRYWFYFCGRGGRSGMCSCFLLYQIVNNC